MYRMLALVQKSLVGKRKEGFYIELPHGSRDCGMIKTLVSDKPQENEHLIIQYLSDGYIFEGVPATNYDSLVETKDLLIDAPHRMTDGTWYWPADLVYYVKNYHVKLNPQFIKHMERNNWKISNWKIAALKKLESLVK